MKMQDVFINAHQALKKYFGYTTFRPMQAEIIQEILAQRDVLVLMPTGGGKSLCFQIPALVMDGVALVISPLISLMKDQVEALRNNGIEAAYLNSSQTPAERTKIEYLLQQGKIKLLYVSPEKLLSGSFLYFLKTLSISLIAIDEAHCISAWGHDFRPEYTRLDCLKQEFPHIPIIALTATADKLTRHDIIERLQLKEPQIFIASFDRPNLSLSVFHGKNKTKRIIDFIHTKRNQSGIIYCLSRKNTEGLAAKLQAEGFKAAFYHAGMSAEERSFVQENFINDTIPIICATIAFGMGIDKSNVRWVIHYNMPKNIEGYYQEIGRAGRDGLPSETMLFYGYGDVINLREMIEQSGQKEIQLAKLERMLQYADALICRRKILLNYFNEELRENCNNCDVCHNPPRLFDGTILIQKALSAIARLQEKVGMMDLIFVLRGAQRKDIIEKGYDKIKTFGAGKDISYDDWQAYLVQMLNLGLVEIAYNENYALKLTPQSKQVLFEGRKIQLVQVSEIKKKEEEQTSPSKALTKTQLFQNELFELLRQLRKQVADLQRVPPYVIFSDATLNDMVEKMPVTPQMMLQIHGVGERKMQEYGDKFIQEIIAFTASKKEQGSRVKGGTHLLTYQYYKEGMSIEEIAQKREISTITVYSHLALLYERDFDIHIDDIVSKEDYQKLEESIQHIGFQEQLKPYFEFFEEKMPYHVIRLGLAMYKKRNMN